MDTTRIQSVIDVATLQRKCVALIGAGASATLTCDLVRSGVQKLILIDPDTVAPENMSRQCHDAIHVGVPKVLALKAKLLSINADAEITTYAFDATKLPEESAAELMRSADLLIAATDRFKAQAWTNRMALKLKVPAVFVGLYAQGLGAEVVWIDPDRLPCCYRCLCSHRYDAQAHAEQTGLQLDPTSDGADALSIRIPDAVAGQIVLGLLTRGAKNKYGRLLASLGDRQFLQFSLSPEFALNGRDIVRERLGIPIDNDAYVAWSAIALRDPDGGHLPCTDCEELRGCQFQKVDGQWTRNPQVRVITHEPRLPLH